MRPNKLSLPSSGYRSPWLSYWTVAAATVCVLFRTLCGGLHTTIDTTTYYSAGNLLFSGTIDVCRTPVYPIILHLLEMIFGHNGSMWAVAILQAIVFAVSVVYVNKSLRILVPLCPRLCFWLTMLYVGFPLDNVDFFYRTLNSYVSWILTESFAFSGTTFLAYCMIRAAQPGASPRYALYIGVWLLLLIFLRPALLCYIPVVAFFFAALYLTRRREVLKSALLGGVNILVVCTLVGIYTYEINRLYHIHSISSVSIGNNYCTLRYGGLITPDDTDDPAFKQFLAENIARHPKHLTAHEMWSERVPVSAPVVEEAVRHAVQTRPGAVIEAIYERFREVHHSNSNMTVIHLLWLFATIILAVCTRRSRRFLLLPWTLCLLMLSLIGTMYVGTYAEWERISYPLLSPLVLFVGWACSKLHFVATR